jgi:hypothetical protein
MESILQEPSSWTSKDILKVKDFIKSFFVICFYNNTKKSILKKIQNKRTCIFPLLIQILPKYHLSGSDFTKPLRSVVLLCRNSMFCRHLRPNHVRLNPRSRHLSRNFTFSPHLRWSRDSSA